MRQLTISTRRLGWRRGAGAAVAGALAAGAISVLAPAAHATTTVATGRLAGADRYATAAVIAAAKFPAGVNEAIVTNGLSFPDALAGSYLAGSRGAAILLTNPTALSAPTQASLAQLKVKNVTILGGTNAVSAGVAGQIAALSSTGASGGPIVVTRIAGATRYDTAAMIDTTPTSVGLVGGKRTAIVASGRTFPDALAASAAAYRDHLPVVLTEPAFLSPQARSTLATLTITQVLIMGGTDAVSAATEAAVNAAGVATLARFAGADRTDTAQRFATYEVANLGFSNAEVTLARGDDFPDALAGSVYAGDPKPILLTPSPGAVGAATCAYLGANIASVAKVTAFGGAFAVNDSTLAAAAACAQPGGPTVPAGGSGATGTGGGPVPAPAPVTMGPNLVSAAITTNGFATANPTVVTGTFDKAVTVGSPAGFRAVGPDTSGANGDEMPTTCGVVAGAPNSVACSFPNTVNVAARTLFEVDGGAVTAGAGGFPNVLGAVLLGGGNVTASPYPLLASAAITDPLAGTVTYTFTQNLAPPAALAGPLFGFVTNDGSTEFVGATAVLSPTSNAAVVVTFAPTAAVAQATSFFVRAGAVANVNSGVANPETSAGAPPSQRPHLVSVARTTNPNQFLFGVDRPATIGDAAKFRLYQYDNVFTGFPGTAAAFSGDSRTFLVTFPTVSVNASTSSTFVLGGIDEALGSGAVRGAAAPTTPNVVGSAPIPLAAARAVNGPLLQSFSASVMAGQATFTFDRLIASASVVPGDFFVVDDHGTATPATALVATVGNQVIVTFSAAALTTRPVTGGGLIGSVERQPGVNGGAPAVAATGSVGDPALGITVAGAAT